MIRITTNVLGVFALKNGKVISKVLFKGSPADIAEKIKSTGDSTCPDEVQLIKEFIKTGLREAAVNQPSRFWGKGLEINFIEDSEKPVDVLQIASDLGFARKDVENLTREVSIHLAREKLKVVDRDQVIMQAVAALDDIEETSNRLVERLREWYSIHYPELNHLVENHEIYAQLVKDTGLRSNFKKESLKLEPGFRDRIVVESSNSVGSEFNEIDVKALQSIAQSLTELYKAKKSIEDYLGAVMQETAPNINALIGPLVGARLVKLANGLKRMATLPASTIQILGAEDAFFRFLRTGKKPPKHGIIFQHPEIRNARREIRGKLARTLATKLSLASKIDAYHGEYMGEYLNESFMKRVNSLKKQ